MNDSYLSKNGYVIKKESITSHELQVLKKELVGRPLVDEKYVNNTQNFLLYTETKSKIYIPKIYGTLKYGIPDKKLDNYIGKKWKSNLEFSGNLYPTQQEASDILYNELINGCGGGILSIFTGGGKTFTALHVLSKLKGKTLIIVNKITLMKQWENEIKACLPGCSIGKIQGKIIDTESKDIVLGMLQSLALIDYPESTFSDINTVVIDECFPYNTCVITSDSSKCIGNLYYMKQNGEELPLVKTFNEITKLFEYKKIINVFRKENDKLIEICCNELIIKSTENHKILTTNGWKEAINLKVNDFIISDYNYIKITKITRNIINFDESDFQKNFVFDMEIEDNHNYLVTQKDINYGIVVHNCHNVPSKVFSKVLMKTASQYTIGLSATPKRGDGCEYVFKYFIGDIVYQCKSNRIGLVPKLNYIIIKSKDYKEIKVENKYTGATQIQFSSMISELIDMNKRNKLIIEIIKNCVTEQRKLLVLSDRREHLKIIHNLLDEDPQVFFTYGLFLGQMKIGDLEKSKASNVILATFSAFSEGISEKDLDTLLLITPKKYIGHLKNTSKNESGKLEQIVGRIFRKDHTEKNPLIIDLHDNFSVYKAQSNSRKVFYKEHFKNNIIIEQSIDLDLYSCNDINIKCLSKVIEKESISNEINECIIDDL